MLRLFQVLCCFMNLCYRDTNYVLNIESKFIGIPANHSQFTMMVTCIHSLSQVLYPGIASIPCQRTMLVLILPRNSTEGQNFLFGAQLSKESCSTDLRLVVTRWFISASASASVEDTDPFAESCTPRSKFYGEFSVPFFWVEKLGQARKRRLIAQMLICINPPIIVQEQSSMS
jgi:hypothetical protein